MAEKYNTTATYDITNRIIRIEERVKALEAGRTTPVSSGPGSFAPASGSFVARDGNGNVRFAVSATNGTLVPYLTHNIVPYTDITTPPASTTSGTFVTLYRVFGEQQNPGIKVRLYIVAGSGTTGEVRLYDTNTSTQLGTTYNVTTAFAGYTTITAALPTTYAQDALAMDVQARRTAGAGSIGVVIAYVVGTE